MNTGCINIHYSEETIKMLMKMLKCTREEAVQYLIGIVTKGGTNAY